MWPELKHSQCTSIEVLDKFKAVCNNLLDLYLYIILDYTCSESQVNNASTGELGYDGLNGTRKIGPSYAKSVIYI